MLASRKDILLEQTISQICNLLVTGMSQRRRIAMQTPVLLTSTEKTIANTDNTAINSVSFG